MGEADGLEGTWQPARLRLNVVHLVVAWAIAVASVYVGAALVPDVGLERPGGAVLVAAELLPEHIRVDSLAGALLTALAISAVTIVLQVLLGSAARRRARRRAR